MPRNDLSQCRRFPRITTRLEVVYAPGRYTYTRQSVGTRYVFVIVRILADPQHPRICAGANAVQDAIAVAHNPIGAFEAPAWDAASQAKVRNALNVLASMRGSDIGETFGTKGEVDLVAHLIGTAVGWGGNPRSAAIYLGVYPKENDGEVSHTLTVRDVPVDGFWSISVYNAKGYFEKNRLDRYSINSLTATPDKTGAFTIQFGGCSA